MMPLEKQVVSLELAKRLKELGDPDLQNLKASIVEANMKLEDQVVSLELAKKLKALNVKQETLFYWTKMRRGDFTLNHNPFHASFAPDPEDISAFTVAELFDSMPDIEILKVSNSFNIRNPLGNDRGISDYKLADALARMKIYLIEQGLVKP